MGHGLSQLNSLTAAEAREQFLKCCGSETWADSMVTQRPFADVAELLNKAAEVWWSLAEADWLAAFHCHPKIGEQKAAANVAAESRSWSAAEQAGTRAAAAETMSELALGNRQYEERFGYIFIVCASGKSATEMLGLLRERIYNDPQKELRVAAGEQSKITQLRLNKLLESLEERV